MEEDFLLSQLSLVKDQLNNDVVKVKSVHNYERGVACATLCNQKLKWNWPIQRGYFNKILALQWVTFMSYNGELKTSISNQICFFFSLKFFAEIRYFKNLLKPMFFTLIIFQTWHYLKGTCNGYFIDLVW